MYDLEIADDVAEALTRDGALRLSLSTATRRLTCDVCGQPLGDPSPPTSVIVVRDPASGLAAIRLAHAACMSSEVRFGPVAATTRRQRGNDWNLLRRQHPRVGAVLAWESHPSFDPAGSQLERLPSADPVATALRRDGFTPANASIARLSPATSCRVALHRSGRHLVLLRAGRRWLEFSHAAVRGDAAAWLAEARRSGHVLLLYGPGLGGAALTAAAVLETLCSGTALCATVRLEASRVAACETTSCPRSCRVLPGGSGAPRRSRGAHGLV
jgi:hypothetical protein